LSISQKVRLRGILQAANHCLRFDLRDQVAHDLALVFADIHEVLLGATKLVDGRENLLWRATDLIDVGLVVDEAKELGLATIVKEDILLRGVGLGLVELWHCKVVLWNGLVQMIGADGRLLWFVSKASD